MEIFLKFAFLVQNPYLSLVQQPDNAKLYFYLALAHLHFASNKSVEFTQVRTQQGFWRLTVGADHHLLLLT